jgi:hypothetical protein
MLEQQSVINRKDHREVPVENISIMMTKLSTLND